MFLGSAYKNEIKKALCVASCCCTVFSWGCTGPAKPSSVNISISNGNTHGTAEENNMEKTIQNEEENDEDDPPQGDSDEDDSQDTCFLIRMTTSKKPEDGKTLEIIVLWGWRDL
jgi:uncharacterized protein (DUF608 family)